MNLKGGRFLRLFSFVLLGLSLLWLAGGLGSDLLEARLSHSEFEAVLAGGAVQEISIRQNRLTPTGEARIVYKGDEKRFSRERYFVSDVNRLQTELEERGIDFRLENPPVGGDFLGYGLLLLLTAGAVFYTFYRRGFPGGGRRRANRTGKSEKREPDGGELRDRRRSQRRERGARSAGRLSPCTGEVHRARRKDTEGCIARGAARYR